MPGGDLPRRTALQHTIDLCTVALLYHTSRESADHTERVGHELSSVAAAVQEIKSNSLDLKRIKSVESAKLAYTQPDSRPLLRAVPKCTPPGRATTILCKNSPRSPRRQSDRKGPPGAPTDAKNMSNQERVPSPRGITQLRLGTADDAGRRFGNCVCRSAAK